MREHRSLRVLNIDLRRHARFMIALLVGVSSALLGWRLDPIDRLLLGADLFFAVYLGLILFYLDNLDPETLRWRSAEADEGMRIIAPVTGGAILLSLFAIFSAMRVETGSDASVLRLGLAVASVPLGWITLHTVMAFHYAGLWYAKAGDGQDAGGLEFPKTKEPGVWDFLYYSFTIGMAAQVSDVQVLNTGLRRITLLHGAISFFYNTVLLALAVNAGANLSS